MAQKFFKLDGKTYDLWVTSLKREASVLDREDAGRTLSGDMDRDIVGTYYNYEMTIDNSNCNAHDYDEFYEKITAPVDYHRVLFPYGQGTLEFKAYTANASDELTLIDNDGNHWDSLTVKFTAMSPQRRA